METMTEIRELSMECGNGPWLFTRPGLRTSRQVFPVGEDGVLFVASEPQLLNLDGPARRDYDVYLCTLGGMIYPLHIDSYATRNGALSRARREHRDWNGESFNALVRRFA